MFVPPPITIYRPSAVYEQMEYSKTHYEEKGEEEEKRLFEAIKGDVISEAITDIINKHGEEFPIIRISANKYLVGRDICQLEMKGRDVSVRIGGGYAKLENFVEKKKLLDRIKIK